MCAVAVMRVIVNDHHALQAFFQRHACADSHVVEQAKAHGAVWFGVVPRRADDGKGVLNFTVQNGARAGGYPPGGQQCVVEGGASHIRGGVVNDAGGFFAADFFQRRDQLGMMDQADLAG